MAARRVKHGCGLETGRVVEAANIDADQIRVILGLVVDGNAADGAKALSLGGAPVARSRDLADFARNLERCAWKHEHRTMPAAGIQLAIPALALKAAHRLGLNFVANRAARAAA